MLRIDGVRLSPLTLHRVLGLYPCKTSASAAHFFEEWVLGWADARPEMPFPIERIPSDSTTVGGGRRRVYRH